MLRYFVFGLLALGCQPLFVNRSAKISSYAARASWQWESCEHFLLKGRARLEGESNVFSGPFFLWVSKSIPAVRADFCGPNGSPLISLLLNSDGCLVYHPEEAQAFYFPGGMPAGSGFLDVYAVISLIRTGFPTVPVQWEMVAACDTSSEDEVRWNFVSSPVDTAVVSLKHSQLFPIFNAGDFSLEITASSWHDQFNAWPMEWRLLSPLANAVIRIRSYDVQTVPHDSAWKLIVPVYVDTLKTTGGSWTYLFDLPVR